MNTARSLIGSLRNLSASTCNVISMGSFHTAGTAIVFCSTANYGAAFYKIATSMPQFSVMNYCGACCYATMEKTPRINHHSVV